MFHRLYDTLSTVGRMNSRRSVRRTGFSRQLTIASEEFILSRILGKFDLRIFFKRRKTSDSEVYYATAVILVWMNRFSFSLSSSVFLFVCGHFILIEYHLPHSSGRRIWKLGRISSLIPRRHLSLGISRCERQNSCSLCCRQKPHRDHLVHQRKGRGSVSMIHFFTLVHDFPFIPSW